MQQWQLCCCFWRTPCREGGASSSRETRRASQQRWRDEEKGRETNSFSFSFGRKKWKFSETVQAKRTKKKGTLTLCLESRPFRPTKQQKRHAPRRPGLRRPRLSAPQGPAAATGAEREREREREQRRSRRALVRARGRARCRRRRWRRRGGVSEGRRRRWRQRRRGGPRCDRRW